MLARGAAFAKPCTPFTGIEYPIQPGPTEAVVQVAGCGLCHTDVGFYYGDVAPRAALPLVLGHEISGTVVAAGAQFEGMVRSRVVVPSVMPCGTCAHCQAGFENTCTRQFMPGNDGHGGFATHIKVPGRYLAPLPEDLKGYQLHELSVIADAVTTPYQSVLRSGLAKGDVAVVVGAGGIGTYAVQIAAAFGAHVVAVDIDETKLVRLRDYGAALTYNSKGQDLKTARAGVRKLIAGAGWPDFGWKIFEMSGSAPGQELAYNLIPPSGTLAVVGFTLARLELRLSNLMAFDATCFGNWGCAPRHYPEVIKMVLDGRINLKPFIQAHPLSQIQPLFEQAHHGGLQQRAILMPEI